MNNQLDKLSDLPLISSVSFGELEVNTLTILVILVLTLFTFLAVGISSFKLVQSAVEEESQD